MGVGVMNKLGKLEEKFRHNYVEHTGGTSF